MFLNINWELTLFEQILSLLSLLFPIAASCLITLIVIRESRRSLASIPDFLPSWSDFIEKQGDTIVIDENLSLLLDAVGKKIASSLRYSFMQGLGAQSKIEKGLKGAMAQDAIDKKMPLLNLVGQFLGINTAEYIAKNPHALAQLAPIINSFMGGQKRNPPSNYGYEGYK